MANYDITMKTFNGTNYDTLFPQNISQQVLLNDSSIATALGITTPNPTVTEAIDKLQLKISNISEYGSYVGTGTYGVDNPNTLTFSVAPKLVIIMGILYTPPSTIYAVLGFFIRGNDKSFGISNSSVNLFNNCTWNDKTLSWYAEDATKQFNASAITYSYIMIG